MKKLNKIKNYLLAFIIPFVICLIFFYFKNVLKLIENLYVSDLRLQHIVFLSYLKNVLLGKASILYSFSAGMGSAMLSTIIFYCVSPVNLLLLVIQDTRYALLFIYIVKVSLAGLTMYMLLSKKYKKDSIIAVVFSTCYALCCFAISYFFCVFWLDSFYFAPLVIWGIEKMFIEEKYNLTYIFTLAAAIICNIQMGFGLCIFSVLYFLYCYNIRYDYSKNNINKFKHLALIFIISSLCVGGISSGALLGFMGEYENISIARSISVSTRAGTTNIIYVLKNLFTVGRLKTDYYNELEPYTYCGLIVTFYFILYLFDKKIDKKKRIHASLMFLAFIISFSIGFINLFWHLSSPVLLNYRYSIYLGLFITMIAYEEYINKEKIDKRDLTIICISLFIGVAMITIYKEEVYLNYSFIFLIVIASLIVLGKNKHKVFEILLLLAVLAETGFNGYLSMYTATDIPYLSYSTYKSLKQVGNHKKLSDDYRITYNYTGTDLCNDTLLLNNHSTLRYFSSVINGRLSKFFERNQSFTGNNNYRVSAYESPLLISLMGNKYFYFMDEYNNDLFEKKDEFEVTNYNYFESKYKKQKIVYYENPLALSLGYIIENDVKYNKKMDNVEYQNKMAKAFSGIDKDVVIKLDYEDVTTPEECANSNYPSCKVYHITNNTNNKNYYVYAAFNEYNLSQNTRALIDVNKPLFITSLNNDIYLKLTYAGDLDKEHFSASTYDKKALEEVINKLKENMLHDVVINKNILNAKIDAKKSGKLFLSIPYDKHFEIYVDGKKTKYYPLMDKTFIGLNIKQGSHKIKLEYKDNRIIIYTILTIVSIIISCLIYFITNKKITKKQEEEKQRLKEIEEKRLAKKTNKTTKNTTNNKKTKNKKRK